MTPKQEVEQLMNEMVPFAKRMLSERGEFYPFGGYMKPTGDVVHVGVEQAGTDEPKPTELYQLLKQSLRERARSQECRATAVLINVRIVPPGSGEKSDAIQVNLDHESGYSAEVFYPYHLDGADVIYAPIFAQKGDGDIFAV